MKKLLSGTIILSMMMSSNVFALDGMDVSGDANLDYQNWKYQLQRW